MKSPVFEVKTTVSGDFNNHKTKYKAINSVGYIFSGTTNQTTTYSYDAAGYLQSVTSPEIAYTFTTYANGWLKTISDGARTTEYAYDAAGRRELVTVK